MEKNVLIHECNLCKKKLKVGQAYAFEGARSSEYEDYTDYIFCWRCSKKLRTLYLKQLKTPTN